MRDYFRRLLFPVWCIGCGAPDVALCAGCAPSLGDSEVSIVAYTGVAAAGRYEGTLRRAIVAMKRGERAYLDPLARVAAALLNADAAVVPLPTSRGRRAARGFDQSLELARRAAVLRGGVCCEVLEKRGAAQRGLGRVARLRAAGRFRIRPGAILPPHAVVFDDVCTTGATLADGIATLRGAGVRVFGAVVLARAASQRNSPGPIAVMREGRT